MKNKDLNAMLARYKKEMPVNRQLKKDLRKSFAKPGKYGLSRYGLLKKVGLVAAVAAVFFAALIFPGLNPTPHVSAAELKVNGYMTLVGVGSDQSLGIGEYSGVVYLPVPGEGIYAYDSGGYRKVFDEEADTVRVSSDGEKLVLSEGGSLYILDKKTGALIELLKGDEKSGIYYEEPNWSPDGEKIVYVKKVIEFRDTHGFDIKESGIYETDLAASSPVKLAEGSNPSYIKGTDFILYEDQQTVVLKDLKKGDMKTVDSGRFPSVSPDGRLIAYVKTETAGREIAKNARVEETLGNIWIADTADTEIRKKVTSNYPYYFVDEEAWLNDLEPSEIPQVLSYSGVYDYYNPVWSSDSRSLFALRNAVEEGQPSGMKLIRIDLGQDTSNPENTVEKYQQALIRRDEDYAKSLLNTRIEPLLTVSNPHPSGYRILSSYKENGKTFVHAEIYLHYTANPYCQIIKSRYELSKTADGYKIDKITAMDKMEVSEQSGVLFKNGGGHQKMLLKLQDIPGEYVGSGKPYRLSSLIYFESNDTLIAAIQHMNEEGRSTSVTLLRYDVKKKSFDLIDRINAESGTVGVSGLSSDIDNKYLSVDIVLEDGDGPGGSLYVYHLEDKSKVNLEALLDDTKIDSIYSQYWFKEGLMFEVLSNGQTMSYLYKPDNGPSVQTVMSGSLAEPDNRNKEAFNAPLHVEQGKTSNNGDNDKDNVSKGSLSKGRAANTGIFDLTIPETWKIEEYPGDFIRFEANGIVIGNLEVIKYYPDQPESQLMPNHSEMIDSETLDDFSPQFANVVMMRLKETGTSVESSSSEQLHLFFINENKNEAYDLHFSSDHVDEDTAIQIGKSFKLK